MTRITGIASTAFASAILAGAFVLSGCLPRVIGACRDSKTGRFVECSKRGRVAGKITGDGKVFYCSDENGIQWTSRGKCR